MADFKAYIKDGEIVCDGPEEKIELFTQFLDEMEDATDDASCDCQTNDKVRAVVESYFPEYADEIMDLFEDNGGYCDCQIGLKVMFMNSVVRKLGRYMDMQEV